ncbi:MAG: cytochrome c [Nitrospinaceae bacterium]|nr:cytochrome c [Nitrospinaceae bacterium]NIR54515.1 cytochrome c [Nitrospinaceae bacterium]NIS84934.1 cytochrome c [Nitrospinaceae bacterium]NIT81748.1 cytochrome c [Nitrospinaceae bacterium]NIU44017.1 cytochrome c [Nitrospinaceae bacterium]
MRRFVLFLAGTGCLIFLAGQKARAFHPSMYTPRVPLEHLEEIQEIESPLENTPANIEAGRQIFFGKGLCVSCHLADGKGKPMPGHSPRNFTDPKWQDARTDGELMWVLRNGSPGTGMPRRVGVVISEEEGWKVIQFIRTFREER